MVTTRPLTSTDEDGTYNVFRADWAHQPPLVEDALGKQMLALLLQLEVVCTAADQLAEAVEEVFPQHPDAEILLSFPGLGTQLVARVLAEIGDDRYGLGSAISSRICPAAWGSARSGRR